MSELFQKGIGGHCRPIHGRTNSWITPKYILDALRPFDFDPCACDTQPWPTASTMLNRRADGLLTPWQGRVWLNPPYGRAIRSWMSLMASHNNGIALVFARTETQWFCESVWGRAAGLLFLHGRLTFYYPTGKKAKWNCGGPSVLIAYGKKNAELLSHCGLVGSYCEEKGASLPQCSIPEL